MLRLVSICTQACSMYVAREVECFTCRVARKLQKTTNKLEEYENLHGANVNLAIGIFSEVIEVRKKMK